jgi:hypothetical protein
MKHQPTRSDNTSLRRGGSRDEVACSRSERAVQSKNLPGGLDLGKIEAILGRGFEIGDFASVSDTLATAKLARCAVGRAYFDPIAGQRDGTWVRQESISAPHPNEAPSSSCFIVKKNNGPGLELEACLPHAVLHASLQRSGLDSRGQPPE